MEIKLKNEIKNDKYTEYVYQAFDVQDREETTVNINYSLEEMDNFEWNIGIIYGSLKEIPHNSSYKKMSKKKPLKK